MTIPFKVIDDALSPQAFDKLARLAHSQQLLWQFSDYVADEDGVSKSDNLEYYHVAKMYEDHHPISKNIKYVEPVFDFLKIKALIRCRFLMYPNHGKQIKHLQHRDFAYEHKAALLYLNTNDGITEFEDGNVVEPKANRLVIHDGSLLHNSNTCTDSKVRTLLSVNYF